MSPEGAPSVRLGSWEELGPAAREIRIEVFVREQAVPLEMEIDEQDPHCLHALASDALGRAVGTGRLLPDGHIGRMAVLRTQRGKGVGAALLRALLEAARQRGHAQVELSSQLHAEGFYRRFGFAAVGEAYEDAGIAHITMRMKLPPTGQVLAPPS